MRKKGIKKAKNNNWLLVVVAIWLLRYFFNNPVIYIFSRWILQPTTEVSSIQEVRQKGCNIFENSISGMIITSLAHLKIHENILWDDNDGDLKGKVLYDALKTWLR